MHTSRSLSPGKVTTAIRAICVSLGLLFGAATLATTAAGATITVNSTADVVADDGVCTLREAITAAVTHTASGATSGECVAGTSGTNTIQFNIGTGTPSIGVTSPLPGITAPVIIDGQTGGATRVEIYGANTSASSQTGMSFDQGANGSTIAHLVINRFNTGLNFQNSSGVTIKGNFIGTDASGTIINGYANNIGIELASAANNTIGGTNPTPNGSCTGDCNLISGNQFYAIEMQENSFFGGANNNTIQGNFIGTDVTGTLPLGNNLGIRTFNDATNNHVVGNVISGNANEGIALFGGGSGANGMVIQGNYIGTNSAGTAVVGNNYGIRFLAGQNGLTIGGSTAGAGNVISGNTVAGISGPLSGSAIQGNFIGTDKTGTVSLSNGTDNSALDARGGIAIFNGGGANTIGGTAAGEANIIAFNAGAGIRFGADNSGGSTGSAGNNVIGNVIYRNNGLGISLSGGGGIKSTPLTNDAGDTDGGGALGNNGQNYPVLTSVSEAGGTITVQGTFNSVPNTTFNIDFYVSQDQDPSGNGEGQLYVGSQTVTTDVNGDAPPISFAYATVAGMPYTTATATNSSTNDTSEFSNALLVANPGQFVFSSTSYSIVESGGTATITVNRVNGSTGAACVDYSTSPGTATVGSDYTTSAGQLCFADGETSKTFTVGIINDTDPEPDETINLTLSGATDGGTVGFQGSATLTIINDDSFQTFVVNSTTDDNDGACTVTKCTLRDAIIAANATPEQDTISFDIGPNNPTITVTTALPTITAPVVIDGSTGGATRVVITSNNISASGLSLSSGGSRSIIRYLVINNFANAGIDLGDSSNNIIEGNYIGTTPDGTAAAHNGVGINFHIANNNLIGGTMGTTPGGACTGSCNLISGNGTGINSDPQSGSANNNIIQGNFIGPDVTGTRGIGNGRGISFLNSVNFTQIGGTTANARNVISDNNEMGIFISAAGAHDNLIQGNYIGVDTTATAKIPNLIGVQLFFTATNNTIGGTVAGAGNVISGNTECGISISTNGGPPSFPPSNNIVQGNFIGTDPTGTLDLGNGEAGLPAQDPPGGVVLDQGVFNNQIGGTTTGAGNIIAFNYGAGIRLGGFTGADPAGTGNSILNNSIYSNNGLGIALSNGSDVISTPLPNDPMDSDGGPNNGQNYPVLDPTAASAGGTVTVTGTFNSVPNTSFTIQLFVSAAPDTSGFGEGQTYVGSTTVKTDATTGTAAITFPYSAVIGKQYITATATNQVTGDTSEFSNVAFDPTPQSNPPVVTASDASGNVGDPITINATYTDSDGPSVGHSATIACGNGTSATSVTITEPLGSNPGTVSGVCTYNTYGTYTATVTVTDALSVSGSDTASVAVNAIPVANDANLATDEDTALNGTLSVTDPDSSSFTYTIVTSPAHGTLVVDSAGNFTYTPAANYNGSDSFTWNASDGQATSNTATVSITINPVNDAPVANSQAVTTNEDTAIGITLAASDVDGDALSYSIVTGPAHGTLSGTAPNLTYTPAANYNGSDSFTFKANDGHVDSNTATVSITINAVNDAPVANSQSVTTNEDTATAITLTASDVDGDSLTYSIVTGPAHGTLSGSAPNVTYTPSKDYNGSDSFTFKANDGHLDSNTATVSITVNPVNDAPVANSQSVTTNEDTATAITLSASDVDGDSLTYTVVTGPAHGSLSGSPPNLTYTPSKDYNGSDSFTFKANDGHVDSNTATVSITVNPVNDAPVANSQSVTTTENTAKNITLTASDVDGDSLTYSVVTPPAHGSLSGTAPNLTYTPAKDYSGSDSFTFKANDGHADSNTATVSITVTASSSPTPTPTPTATPSATPTATPSATPTPTPGAQATNLSTRALVETGDNVLIGGFIITGDASKKVIVRAIGPSINNTDGTPLAGTLQDPVLELHGPNGALILRNDNWKDTQQQQIEDTGLAPKDDRESAIVATLPPGKYTIVVSGKDSTTGIALVEAYDLAQSAPSQLANISTRGFVKPEDNVMIGGFMLGGANKGASRLAIRGLGPSLSDDDVNGPLSDPTLDLRDKDGNRIEFNDNYGDKPDEAAELASNGLTPNDQNESGIFITLQPGTYTVIMDGKDGATGVGLVEIYNLR